MTAARNHTADMVQNNFQGHEGSDGSTLQQRYQRVNYQSIGLYGENVSAYAESVWFGHCGLMVDWGTQNQIELGHRRNLLNFDSQVYTEIGIGITKTNGGLQQGTVGPYVITQDFGIRNVKYITGVVYDDKNNNDFYDVGEGMAGVRVDVPNGQYYAVTSTSGGYAIPYTGTGPVIVTASGGGLATPQPQPVTVGSDNVKLDFTNKAALPEMVELGSPLNGTEDFPIPVITYAWKPAPWAFRYTIQVASDPSFSAGSIVWSKSSIEDTIETGPVPECSTSYYWRVRGSNALGEGPWSETWRFAVKETRPNAPTLTSPLGEVSADAESMLTFRWDNPDSALYSHMVVRSTGAAIVDTTIENTVGGWTILDLPVSLFPANELLTWEVSERWWCGFGPTDTGSFTLTVTSIQEDAASGDQIYISPHPATSLSTIQFEAVVSGTYRIRLVDAAGAKVATRSIRLDAGVQSVRGLFNSVASGAYVAVIEGPRSVQRLSVVVTN